MFDALIRELERMERGISVPVRMSADEDGYYDKECPNTECEFQFKVHGDDWRDIVRDDAVFCPRCGTAAPAKSWYTKEQVEDFKKQGLAQASELLSNAMREDARRWNQRQPTRAFLKITMEVSGRPHQVALPRAAMEPMRVRICCGECRCRFAVIGSAFFCPSCGRSAAEHVFGQSLAVIRSGLGNLNLVRDSIADRDVAENTVRLIVESTVPTAVMAFQRFAEALFERTTSAPTPRRNAFQSLYVGGQLWQSAFGRAFDHHLSPEELKSLRRFFHQRHLLSHKEGIVDEEYITQSGDTAYAVGQRLVIRPESVLAALSLIEKLAVGLRRDASARPLP